MVTGSQSLVCEVALSVCLFKGTTLVLVRRERREKSVADSLGGRPKGKLPRPPSPWRFPFCRQTLSSSLLLQRPSPLHCTCCVSLPPLLVSLLHLHLRHLSLSSLQRGCIIYHRWACGRSTQAAGGRKELSSARLDQPFP